MKDDFKEHIEACRKINGDAVKDYKRQDRDLAIKQAEKFAVLFERVNNHIPFDNKRHEAHEELCGEIKKEVVNLQLLAEHNKGVFRGAKLVWVLIGTIVFAAITSGATIVMTLLQKGV